MASNNNNHDEDTLTSLNIYIKSQCDVVERYINAVGKSRERKISKKIVNLK